MNCDPYALAEIIRQPAYIKTKVVLLHAGHPWSQSAASLTHALPNVWMDFSWTCPWVSLRMAETFKDVLGVANLDKLMLGSGGHDTPEMAWLCSSLAKGALAEVSDSFISRDVLSAAQCLNISKNLLADNALRLYARQMDGQKAG
ncbi:amidohydrolase family protein [Xinfangfangia sp. CPCC 101601]|uniref:Amidohydrolase family protein n=1 Tax=Pseudogemmobacter lacusdianii TaxID=3069608 RepID=A0ABU0W146_9RHOB|nr:amidohydrolase family protein [Xinfangfangia sp. CPCC 101601]MDQ2067736.1 amidohydrolase family protein [Xinfangfangia sp. CPCC 101601]